MSRQRELSSFSISYDLGQALTRRLVVGCIRDLQRMQDCLLSGDDSPLHSIWEEICVQQQRELSHFWRAYEETITACAEGRIESLQPYELDALWLLTRQGEDWDCEMEDERESYPVFQRDVADYIQDEILNQANNWTNERIRRYLERGYEVG
ncbi:hypothetical protein [Pseudomonas fluorescens]|uniref:hypothetical protein n=1 Tax=Pseudomonas fluorescens TaxID=294 RepID=UPI00058A6939|nr:hypothetical protein [Pseudomonas fluorescens]CEL31708.1 hypothetical protein SRM1_05077 [Pseudomonas fluorescens]